MQEQTAEDKTIIVVTDGKSEHSIKLEKQLIHLGYQIYWQIMNKKLDPSLAEEEVKAIILYPNQFTQQLLNFTHELKALFQPRYIPALYIVHDLSDDFDITAHEIIDEIMSANYHESLLSTKLQCLARIRHRVTKIRRQEKELANYKQLMATERVIAKNLFESFTRAGALNYEKLRYLLSPMSTFSGDFLLAAQNPKGDLHVILGDFTGHGLPAAIGTMPVASAFYTMTEKGLSIEVILQEINKKLQQILPTGFFCAAAMLSVSSTDNTVQVWNGGLPDGIIYRCQEGPTAYLCSSHLPLGILKDAEFSTELDSFEVKENDKIYLFSDGVIEAENDQGEMFGEGRLLELFEQEAESNAIFTRLEQKLSDYRYGKDQGDDITLMELTI